MRTVTYHLVGTGALGLTVTQAQVVRPGRAIAVRQGYGITAGAAVTGVTLTAELNNTSSNSGSVNNPPRETILGSISCTLPAAANFNAPPSTIPLDIPLKAGDLLSANCTIGGIAPVTFLSSTDIVVVES